LQAAMQLFQSLNINDIEDKGNPCYPVSYRHSSLGSYLSCVSMMSSMLRVTDDCPYQRCAFNGVYQPFLPISLPFLAIENFFYTSDFFGYGADQTPDQITEQSSSLQNLQQSVSSEQNHFLSFIQSKGSEYCSVPWPEIKMSRPTVPETELASFCFSAAYQSAILQALGFTKEHNIRPVRTINNRQIEWEIGAVLQQIILLQHGNTERLCIVSGLADSCDSVSEPSYSSYSSSSSVVQPIFDNTFQLNSTYMFAVFIAVVALLGFLYKKNQTKQSIRFYK